MLQNKTLLFGALAFSGFLLPSEAVSANEIDNYEDYRLYCGEAAYRYGVQSPDCSRLRNIYEGADEQKYDNNQLRRRDTDNNNSSKDYGVGKKGYIGATFGAFFPSDDFGVLDTGIGVSLYGGIKFNKNFSADLEVDLLGGGTEESNVTYGISAIFINPRFTLPFSDKKNSSSIFLSPGIGLSTAGINVEDVAIPDVGNDFEIDDVDVVIVDDTRITWQIKAGVTTPVSEKLDLLGQVRFASQFEENTVEFFGTEIGLNLKI